MIGGIGVNLGTMQAMQAARQSKLKSMQPVENKDRRSRLADDYHRQWSKLQKRHLLTGVFMFRENSDPFDEEEYMHREMYHEDDEPLIPRNALYDKVLSEVQFLAETGPKKRGKLEFVESNWFQLLGGVIIVVNVILMVQEWVHPRLEKVPFIEFMDEIILVFYVMELILKMLHFRSDFWSDETELKWNLLDFVIVTLGVLDQWVVPVITMESDASTGILQHTRYMRILRVFRIFRLLRILKLVAVVLRADFSWTETAWFQSFMGFIIGANSLIMGLETDIESSVWWWFEQAFLIIYVFELVVRLRRFGVRGFFYEEQDNLWNWLDFLIVCSGIADQWFLPLWQPLFQNPETDEDAPHNKSMTSQVMMALRMFRILRVLRLVRLIRAIRPLFILSLGIVKAMQSMFWVLVLTLVALYAFAILTTRMVGHALIVDDPEDLPGHVRHLFRSIPDSMFTLFGVMNGKEWKDIAPLLDMLPWTKPIFVVFIICSSWALLSVMTGVVSDNMISVREMQEAKDNAADEEAKKQLKDVLLSQVFSGIDTNGNGTISNEEYKRALRDEEQQRKIGNVTKTLPADLEVMFDWFDMDGSGSIDYDELMRGFEWLKDDVSGKSLLKLACGMRIRLKHFDSSARMMARSVTDRLSNVEKYRDESHQDILKTLEKKYGARKPKPPKPTTEHKNVLATMWDY